MAHTVRIQSRGRLTLPREVRRALQLEPGSEVVLQETAPGRYELKTEARTPALLQEPARQSTGSSRRALVRAEE